MVLIFNNIKIQIIEANVPVRNILGESYLNRFIGKQLERKIKLNNK